MAGNESVSSVPKLVEQVNKESWTRWTLNSVNGDQFWQIDDESTPYSDEELDDFSIRDPRQHSSDVLYRNQHLQNASVIDCPEWMDQSLNFRSQIDQRVCRASTSAINYFTSLQMDDGHWAGDYGGPMFLLPGLVIVSHITQSPFPRPHQQLMIKYMLNHQLEDGGWGLHIEDDSTMFGTVMQYVALRLLGVDPTHPALKNARDWIQSHGGAEGTPSWGKFYLAALGIIDWKGCNSLAPELWLLPKSLPIHPWRYWCHSRMVYLPMSYCYGMRLTCEVDSLIISLRSELLSQPYADIKWQGIRSRVADTDVFMPMSGMARNIYKILNGYEHLRIPGLRKKALSFILDYVKAEDAQTDSIDIGPVNQVLNSLVTWHALGKESKEFKAHRKRWKNYLWVAEDGMKMNGYNGSQLWDTAFAVQAIMENRSVQYTDNAHIIKSYDYLRISQIREEVADREKFFRHPSVGGWPFSTLAHGWPISDCTAEGLKAALAIHKSGLLDDDNIKMIPDSRLMQAADLILSLQNSDGGWATYENTRGPSWLEKLNPSEIYGNIMIDYSWVECTSACITALIEFTDEKPGYRTEDITKSIQRGIEFIVEEQRKDGSWVGSWGICFTYGTWFAVEALTRAYQKGFCDSMQDRVNVACEFLLSRQKEDGGWGESFRSCVEDRYVEHEESQVVNTSWALLTLMAGDYDQSAIDKGMGYLLEMQGSDGDWPQQGISGVFNQNCMISYSAYRNIFPIWALGRYQNFKNKQWNSRG